MSVSGLLEIFEELPAYRSFREELRQKVDLPPLGLPDNARAATLARLYQDDDFSWAFE